MRVLVVENTGERLESVATLVEPFRRGTDRVQTGRSGLELAIVDSIVRAHDGTLTLRPRAAGGLRVAVHLPSTSDVTPGPPARLRPR